jgi:hypothetical protein
MVAEFEDRNLSDSVFWGVDLRRAAFRDVNLSGVSTSHALLEGVDIDAKIDRLVIDGVDVTDYVNHATAGTRCARWCGRLTRGGPGGMGRAGADAGRDDRLRRPPHRRAAPRTVDGEWSLVETLRHLLFAMDKWFTAPILGEGFLRSASPIPARATFRGPISTVTP